MDKGDIQTPPRLPARRRAFRARRGVLLLVAVVAAAVAGCGDAGEIEYDELGVPIVEGMSLAQADEVLSAWCANVRILLDPASGLTVDALRDVDRDIVLVSGQEFHQVEPAEAVDSAIVLREGGVGEPPPDTSVSPAPDGANPAPDGASPTASPTGPPPVCLSGSVPALSITLRTEVPDLVGTSIADAAASLEAYGLPYEVAPDAPDDIPARVLEQSVEAGTSVDLGPAAATVVLTPGVEMPSVIGFSRMQACTRLASVGLACTPTGSADDVVDAQSVPSATLVAIDATVELTLVPPEASPPVAVPAVIGDSGADACAAVEDQGLACELDGDARDEVISQSPSSGVTVSRPATVQLLTRQPTVPEVVTLPVAEACAAVEDAGLKCEQLTFVDNGQLRDTVIGQSPSGGSSLARDEAVRLTVVGWVPVSVPPVFGLSAYDACARIQTQYLICDPSGDRGNDRVERQTPAAGSVVQPGETIRLEFGVVPWTDTTWGKLVLAFLIAVAGALGTLLVRKLFSRPPRTR